MARKEKLTKREWIERECEKIGFNGFQSQQDYQWKSSEMASFGPTSLIVPLLLNYHMKMSVTSLGSFSFPFKLFLLFLSFNPDLDPDLRKERKRKPTSLAAFSLLLPIPSNQICFPLIFGNYFQQHHHRSRLRIDPLSKNLLFILISLSPLSTTQSLTQESSFTIHFNDSARLLTSSSSKTFS